MDGASIVGLRMRSACSTATTIRERRVRRSRRGRDKRVYRHARRGSIRLHKTTEASSDAPSHAACLPAQGASGLWDTPPKQRPAADARAMAPRPRHVAAAPAVPYSTAGSAVSSTGKAYCKPAGINSGCRFSRAASASERGARPGCFMHVQLRM